MLTRCVGCAGLAVSIWAWSRPNRQHRGPHDGDHGRKPNTDESLPHEPVLLRAPASWAPQDAFTRASTAIAKYRPDCYGHFTAIGRNVRILRPLSAKSCGRSLPRRDRTAAAEVARCVPPLLRMNRGFGQFSTRGFGREVVLWYSGPPHRAVPIDWHERHPSKFRSKDTGADPPNRRFTAYFG